MMKSLEAYAQLPPLGRRQVLIIASLAISCIVYSLFFFTSSAGPSFPGSQHMWSSSSDRPSADDVSSLPASPWQQGENETITIKPEGEHGSSESNWTKCKISSEIWKKAQDSYKELKNDKFTVVIEVFDAPDVLTATLDAFLREKIPSLHEIVIVWTDQTKKHPDNFTSKHKTPVRYRTADRKSLNQKLMPDEYFETQAILITNGDTYYQPADLEFAFQIWKQFGQRKIVGAEPHCVMKNDNNEWRYTACSKDPENNHYSMIDTNLAFLHISFMHYYHSADADMVKVREFINENIDCESIAMNFVASMVAKTGPLLVEGSQPWVNHNHEGETRDRLDLRSQCVAVFAKHFGCMPLYEETIRMARGNGLA